MNNNQKAFLDMIAHSEIGPALLAVSNEGYDVIVGSTPKNPILFTDYSDHPRKLVTQTIKGNVVKSTAAGRYQILARYYDAYKTMLKLPDFSPSSQDAIALQLIRECKALKDIDTGFFLVALQKCRSRWASLPGAGYSQHENKAADLQAAYVNAGGRLA
jgi:muramidase (phage lysozyme)